MLWDDPYLLARPLADAKADDAFDADDVVYAILFSLYGNFYVPREEHAVLRIMEVRRRTAKPPWRSGTLTAFCRRGVRGCRCTGTQHLLQANIERSQSPQAWLRDNSLFSRMFMVYAKYAVARGVRELGRRCSPHKRTRWAFLCPGTLPTAGCT